MLIYLVNHKHNLGQRPRKSRLIREKLMARCNVSVSAYERIAELCMSSSYSLLEKFL